MVTWHRLTSLSAASLAGYISAATLPGRHDIPEENCWEYPGADPEDCCNVQLHGPWGNQACWTFGFSFSLCCQEKSVAEEALLDRLLLNDLLLALAEDPQLETFRTLLSEEQVHFADWAGRPRKTPVIAAVSALLELLLSGGAAVVTRAELRQALTRFVLPIPLREALDSRWPVFALVALLSSHAAATQIEPSSENATSRGQSAPVARCLLGCSPDTSLTTHAAAQAMAGCCAACTRAAAEIPAAHQLQQRQGSTTQVAAKLFDVLLEEAERALKQLEAGRLGAEVLLQRPELWRSLAQLQGTRTIQAACPDSRPIFFQSASDPPYDLCISRATAGPALQDYMVARIVHSGHWRDCDLLRDAIHYSRRSSCLGSLWGNDPVERCLAIDVGSSLGACSAYLLALGFDVVAFDPVAANVESLKASAWRAVADGRLVAVQAAATDAEGLRGAVEESWAPFLADGDVGEVAIPGIRLDRFLIERRRGWPAIMKIDVEGEELFVLRGAEELFANQMVAAILLEVHPVFLRQRGIDSWEPFEFLERFGFRFEFRHPTGFHEVNKELLTAAQEHLVKERQVRTMLILAFLQ